MSKSNILLRLQRLAQQKYTPWFAINIHRVSLPFTFVATQKQYAHHLIPIYKAMPKTARGLFHVPTPLHTWLKNQGIEPCHLNTNKGTGPLVTAGICDIETATRRPIIYVEHGVGMQYANICFAHLPGGHDARDRVNLFLSPSYRCGKIDQEAHPWAQVSIVGCPKMDKYFVTPNVPKPPTTDYISFSTHWDWPLIPETRSAWPEYRWALKEAARSYKILGHAHPRWGDKIYEDFKGIGLIPCREPNEIFEKSMLHICDNSSLLYEFNLLNRPSVVINSKHYRKNVQHGLRFWDHIPGCMTENLSLVELIASSLAQKEETEKHRKAIADLTYVNHGTATQAAVSALLEWQETYILS